MIHQLVGRELSAAAYVDELQRYAEASPAIHHPLLDRIARGEFRAPAAALRRFFAEYYAYSCRFTRFLASVMSNLERPEHRAALVPNSAEEAGHLDDHHRAELRASGIDPDDVAAPHPELFRRFLTSVGLQVSDLGAAVPHVATSVWIQTFDSLCRADEATAVGALGIATEGVVRGMYEKLLAGIRHAWPELGMRERAFFELHALVDDDHADTLRGISIELASAPASRRALAVGVLGALAARASFYDHMSVYLAAADAAEVDAS